MVIKMRIVKIIIWILLAFVLRAFRIIEINGCMPDFLLAFSVIFAVLERSDLHCAYTMLICGILSGSCTGHIFSLDVMIIGGASVAAHALHSHALFVPKLLKALPVILAGAALMGVAQYFIVFKTVDIGMLAGGLIIYAVYTGICGCIMYPLMVKTLFRSQSAKFFTI